MIPPDNPTTDTPATEFPAENLEAAKALGQTMKRLHRHISSKVMRGMQAELSELDLSFTQMTALHQLRASDGMTVTELSERTHLSLPATSHLVERLVKRGLVQREENPENRREKVLKLSASGLETLSGMDSEFVRAYMDTFAPLKAETILAATATLAELLDELEPNGQCPFEPKENP